MVYPISDDGPTDEPELRAPRDLDGDGREELTVIVPVETGINGLLEGRCAIGAASGLFAAIYDTADLHRQFATSRRVDATISDSSSWTTWRFAKDDSHGLLLRNATDRFADGMELDPASSGTVTCAYLHDTDRWNCPRTFGRELFVLESAKAGCDIAWNVQAEASPGLVAIPAPAADVPSDSVAPP